MLVDVFEVTLKRKQVDVPDTCPKCGNAFNEPSESSLLAIHFDSDSFWSYVETVRGQRRLSEGERDGSGPDRRILVEVQCGECGYELAAPAISEAAP